MELLDLKGQYKESRKGKKGRKEGRKGKEIWKWKYIYTNFIYTPFHNHAAYLEQVNWILSYRLGGEKCGFVFCTLHQYYNTLYKLHSALLHSPLLYSALLPSVHITLKLQPNLKLLSLSQPKIPLLLFPLLLNPSNLP